MHLNRSSLVLSLVIAALQLTHQTASAAWHALDDQGRNGTGAEIKVVASDSSGTTLRFTLHGYDAESFVDSSLPGLKLARVRVPGMSLTDKQGNPELPRIQKNILIPEGAVTQLQLLEADTIQVDLGRVAPSKGTLLRSQDPARVGYRLGGVYLNGGIFPESFSKSTGDFTFRDARGVGVAFEPFRFNAATGMTEIAHRITVKVSTHLIPGMRTSLLRQSAPLDSSFSRLYAGTFINYAALLGGSRSVDHLIQDTGKLLIISAPEFSKGLDEFISWKQKRGIQVTLATTDEAGRTYTQIKDFIRAHYIKDRISSVILVGDAEFVPTHPGDAGNVVGEPADPLYGTLEGNDAYPEVMIARFSVKNLQHLANITNRMIQYERNPDLGGEWYSRATGIASNEGSPTDWERVEELRLMLEKSGFSSVDKIYEPSARKSDIDRALNAGRSFLNYTGHGSVTSWGTTGYNTSDIDALKNHSKLPVIVSVACVNGSFDSYAESFAERWLLAGTPANPTGAIAIFASSTNQSWVPPTVGQKEMTRMLTAGEMDTVGMLFTHGAVAVLEDGSDSAVQTFESWHTFGDPTLQIRTKKPTQINARIPSIIEATPNGHAVLDLGVAGVTASLTNHDGLVAAGKSGEDGTLVLNFFTLGSASVPMTLTLSAPNSIPVEAEVSLK